jgi:hypothetical protein
LKYANHIFFLKTTYRGARGSGNAYPVKEYENRGKMQINAERIYSYFGFVAHEW